MNCSLAKITKVELENCVLPFIPKNKRGFSSNFNQSDIFKCIVHKLKTGCQWSLLFVDIECVKPPFSWQTVYYFYSKWSKQGVFKQMFDTYLIFQNGQLIHEKYYDDYDSSTISGSFSMAKTVNALLIGKLIEEGKIGSINDDIKKYVPQLTQIKEGELTIKDVITMSADIDWKESYWNIFSMTAESYYGEDLDHLMEKLKVRKDQQQGKIWEYQSCCTQILGYIIKNVSNKSISEYTKEILWQPLGMENDALWSTDKNGGIEKSFCCLNATARDFGKLGELVLQKGKVDSTQIIPEQWIADMTKPASYLKTADGRTCDWYGYQTWIIHQDNMSVPYFRGVHGQFIYVIPEKNAVIVRLGKKIEKKNIDEHEQNDDIKAYLRFGLSLLKTLSQQVCKFEKLNF